MNNIINISMLIKANIDEDNYIESLIEVLFNYNLINREKINIIRDKLVFLLLKHLKRYTGGVNNTVSLSIAKNINKSCMWTLGIYLRKFEPKQSFEILLNENILDVYAKGNNEVESLINKTKIFYNSLFLNNLIENDNYFYNATLKEGVKGFFEAYNKDYDACNIIINFDYEPFLKKFKGLGIECVNNYLKQINNENAFCNCFDSIKIKKLLENTPNYQNVPINIYETVLITALLLQYLNNNPFSLNINNIDTNTIYYNFNTEQEKFVQNLSNSYNELINSCNIINDTYTYLINSKDKIINIILKATLHKKLESLIHKEKSQYLHYYFSPKMSNDNYIKLIDELNNAQNKIQLLLTKVNSLLDIIDLLEEIPFTSNELQELFSSLTLIEIMVLKQYFAAVDTSINDELNSYIMTKSSKDIKIILNNYRYISSINFDDNI